MSPILRKKSDVSFQINNAWKSVKKLFEVTKNTSCGSHIHVAPQSLRGYSVPFDLQELKDIAYAVATQEKWVQQILPEERIDNDYASTNSSRSEDLKLDLDIDEKYNKADENDYSVTLGGINAARDVRELVRYIQGDSRYVIWNFQNALPGKSGTIEFRGGRHLRGPVRTKRWMTFAVSFIHKAVMDGRERADKTGAPGHSNIDEWWDDIDTHALAGWQHYLPKDWKQMRDIV